MIIWKEKKQSKQRKRLTNEPLYYKKVNHRATFRKIKHSVQVLFIGIVYMAPPPTLEHLSILNNEFYDNYNFFGRDKLFNMLRDKYGEDKSPSRRQIADWLKQQEVNQINTPSKGKPREIKSSMTTPNTILAMDLVDLQKFQVRGFKYLLNAIDMSSRFIYSVALKNKEEVEVLNGFKKIYIARSLARSAPTSKR